VGRSPLERRLAALEGRFSALVEEQHIPAYEVHEHRAWAGASHAERDALSQYLEDGDEAGFLRLWEEVLHREAPTLAADVRVCRDFLWRALSALEKEWDAQGRRRSTSYSDPAYWNLRTAEANRIHALQLGLTEAIENEEEAKRILEQVIALDTSIEEILRLVGRI
jgi:hypothetical protein